MAEGSTPEASLSEILASPVAPVPQLLHRNGSVLLNKALTSAATLVKLLPSSTVFAFHALSPSFSNSGLCFPSNRYLTALLISLCSLSCFFFSFTDSYMGRDGKVYYGVATFKGLYIFNRYAETAITDSPLPSVDLSRLQIRWMDFIHALLSLLVFVTVALGDSEVMQCFFPKASPNQTALLVNLRLGAVFLSSVFFLIFPTSRKGIGYLDMAHPTR